MNREWRNRPPIERPSEGFAIRAGEQRLLDPVESVAQEQLDLHHALRSRSRVDLERNRRIAPDQQMALGHAFAAPSEGIVRDGGLEREMVRANRCACHYLLHKVDSASLRLARLGSSGRGGPRATRLEQCRADDEADQRIDTTCHGSAGAPLRRSATHGAGGRSGVPTDARFLRSTKIARRRPAMPCSGRTGDGAD